MNKCMTAKPSLPDGITVRERDRMLAEIERVPVGARVTARSCPGLGTGVVRELIVSGGRNGELPYHGFVEARVSFHDDFGETVETFNTKELHAVGGP